MAKRTNTNGMRSARVPRVTLRRAHSESMRVRVLGAAFDVREFGRRLQMGGNYLCQVDYDPLEFGAEGQILYSEEAGKPVDVMFVKVEGAGPDGEAEIWARKV